MKVVKSGASEPAQALASPGSLESGALASSSLS